MSKALNRAVQHDGASKQIEQTINFTFASACYACFASNAVQPVVLTIHRIYTAQKQAGGNVCKHGTWPLCSF